MVNLSLSSSLNLASDIIPTAIGTNPATAYGVHQPILNENSPAAIKRSITNAKDITDRLRGMKNLNVSAHTRMHNNEHATGHQIAFPEIMNSRQSDRTEYPKSKELLVDRYFAGLI